LLDGNKFFFVTPESFRVLIGRNVVPPMTLTAIEIHPVSPEIPTGFCGKRRVQKGLSKKGGKPFLLNFFRGLQILVSWMEWLSFLGLFHSFFSFHSTRPEADTNAHK
jgi:hypothetical protein